MTIKELKNNRRMELAKKVTDAGNKLRAATEKYLHDLGISVVDEGITIATVNKAVTLKIPGHRWIQSSLMGVMSEQQEVFFNVEGTWMYPRSLADCLIWDDDNRGMCYDLWKLIKGIFKKESK